jgi:hypothetical protein
MLAILSEPDDGFQILIEKSSHNVHISRKPLMCQWAPVIISFMICRPLACNGPMPLPGRNHIPLS